MSRPPSRPNADGWRWLFVALGVVLRVIPWARNPPVWQDEAALVLNVLHFDFAGFFGPLIHHQAAPPPGALEYVSEGGPQLILVPAGDNDIGAGFSQSARHGLAQTFAAAGDQRHFVFEIKKIHGFAPS